MSKQIKGGIVVVLLAATSAGQIPTREYIYAGSRMIATENYGCGTPGALNGTLYYDGGAQRGSITYWPGGSWTLTTNASWITFPNGTSGSGSTVCFALAANNPITGAPRVATIWINGNATTIVQRRMGQIFGDLPPDTQANAAFHFDSAHILFDKAITTGCQAMPRIFCGTSALPRMQMAVFFVRAWSLRKWGDPEAFPNSISAAHGSDFPGCASVGSELRVRLPIHPEDV